MRVVINKVVPVSPILTPFEPRNFNMHVMIAPKNVKVETMTEKQPSPKQGLGTRSVGLVALVVLAIIISGWTLVTVSTTFQAPSSDFIALPNTPLSKSGVGVMFSNVYTVMSHGLAAGVSGYLVASSGSPIAKATVYMTYYFQGSYRTEVATTDQNGYFEASFPMNWTGSLPLTLTYFGDAQHRGLSQVFSVPGQALALRIA